MALQWLPHSDRGATSTLPGQSAPKHTPAAPIDQQAFFGTHLCLRVVVPAQVQGRQHVEGKFGDGGIVGTARKRQRHQFSYSRVLAALARSYHVSMEHHARAPSARAWALVFASLQGVIEPAVFQVLFPDWRMSQQRAVEEVCDGEESHVWVAVELHTREGIGEVYMIAVDPAAQRRGIGTALMTFAIDWMREAGMAVAMIATRGDEGHAPARRTYEQLGFGPLPLVQYYKPL